MCDRRKIVKRDENIIEPHTIQFCCGTTCDAAANLEYVKRIELELIDLEDRNTCLVKINTAVHQKVEDLQEERKLLHRGIEAVVDELIETHAKCTERGMTIKARDRSLRMLREDKKPIRFIHPDHME